MLLAVVVIFLLLAANFQSLKLSLIVVSTVPAVIAGVVLDALADGHDAEHPIVHGRDHGRRRGGGERDSAGHVRGTQPDERRRGGRAAAVDGARSRLRPILMTSLAMIAGMMPMALGLGEGGEQTAPLGRAVVGGLAAATLATLLVLPSVFAIVQARSHRRSASLDPDDEASSLYRPISPEVKP